jgi:hypothetical protein
MMKASSASMSAIFGRVAGIFCCLYPSKDSLDFANGW